MDGSVNRGARRVDKGLCHIHVSRTTFPECPVLDAKLKKRNTCSWLMRFFRAQKSRHPGCFSSCMMTTLLIFIALVAAGFLTEITSVSNAPLGYQDETGFHFGGESSHGHHFLDSENPS
jgi:hypothetical protein